MAANNFQPPNDNKKLDSLIASATAVPEEELRANPFEKPQPATPFWRLIDFLGKFAAPLGLAFAVLGFAIGTIGGPDFAWASFLYIGTTICFIIFAFAFVRKERREREALYLQERAKQNRLKAEIARNILEQQNKDE